MFFIIFGPKFVIHVYTKELLLLIKKFEWSKETIDSIMFGFILLLFSIGF